MKGGRNMIDRLGRVIFESDTNNSLSEIKAIVSKIRDYVKRTAKPPTGNQNCQLCTWCTEAHMRGFDVLPRPVYSPRDPVFNIKGESIVKNPTRQSLGSGLRSGIENLLDLTEIEGGRWYCHVNWYSSQGGHEFILMRINKVLYVVDSQQGLVTNALSERGGEYFNDIKWGNSYIVRLDDKEFNEEMFMKNNDPSQTLPWDEDLDIPYMRENGMLPDEDINEAKVERINDEGDTVPEKCDKCGSHVGLYLKGEPVWLCSNKKCGKYFGTTPCNFQEATTLKTVDMSKMEKIYYWSPIRLAPDPDQGDIITIEHDGSKLFVTDKIGLCPFYTLYDSEIFENITEKYNADIVPVLPRNLDELSKEENIVVKLISSEAKPKYGDFTLYVYEVDKSSVSNIVHDKKYKSEYLYAIPRKNGDIIVSAKPVKVSKIHYTIKPELSNTFQESVEYTTVGEISLNYFGKWVKLSAVTINSNFTGKYPDSILEDMGVMLPDLTSKSEDIFNEECFEELKLLMISGDKECGGDNIDMIKNIKINDIVDIVNPQHVYFEYTDTGEPFMILECKCNIDEEHGFGFLFNKSADLTEMGFGLSGLEISDNMLKKQYFQESTLPDGVFLRPANESDLLNIIKWKLESVNPKTRNDPKTIRFIENDAKENLKDTKMIMSYSTVIGVLESCYIDDGEWWYIGEIYLIPEYRGKGIARVILQQEIDSHDKLKLRVSKDNTHAIDLYESLGFGISEEDEYAYTMTLVKDNIQEFEFLESDHCELFDESDKMFLKNLADRENRINPMVLRNFGKQRLQIKDDEMYVKLERHPENLKHNIDIRCNQYYRDLFTQIKNSISSKKWLTYESLIKKLFNVLGIEYSKNRTCVYWSPVMLAFKEKEYEVIQYDPSTDVLVHASPVPNLMILKPSHCARDGGAVYPTPRIYFKIIRKSELKNFNNSQYGKNIYVYAPLKPIEVSSDRESNFGIQDKYSKAVFINTKIPIRVVPIDKYTNNLNPTIQESTLPDGPHDDYTPTSVCENMVRELKRYAYGIPVNGKIQNVPSSEYFDKHYRLLSPDEFEKYGGGVCWDYVEFMEGYLDAYGYSCKKYYISTDTKDGDTHTFITVDDGKGGLLYPESSFKLIEGLHKVKNVEEAIKMIASKMFDVNNNSKKYSEIKYYVWEYTGHPEYGSNSVQCTEYFSKGEPFYEGTAINPNKQKIVKESVRMSYPDRFGNNTITQLERTFMEADDDSDDDGVDLDSFGSDNDGSSPNNQYDEEEVSRLNELISDENHAVGQYFEAAKTTNNEVLRRLFSDIGSEERFHTEQLLYAKSTITGEKYEPMDKDVKKEYEELLAMGMDEEDAFNTAIDKQHLNDEDDGDDSDMEDLAVDTKAIEESFIYFNDILSLAEIITESDLYESSSELMKSVSFIMETTLYMEEVGPADQPKSFLKNNPITVLIKGFFSFIKFINGLVDKIKLFINKIQTKQRRMHDWIKKNGIKALFENGVNLYFYNEDERSVQESAILYADMLTRLVKMIGLEMNINFTPRKKFNVDSSKAVPFNNINDGLRRFKIVVFSKTKVVVTDNNEAMLAATFFGYNTYKNAEGKSVNIYNVLENIADAVKVISEDTSKFIEHVKNLDRDLNSIYYKDRKKYMLCVEQLKQVYKGLTIMGKALASDMNEILKLNNGLLEKTRAQDKIDMGIDPNNP